MLLPDYLYQTLRSLYVSSGPANYLFLPRQSCEQQNTTI
jgi:hypothetical protein